MQLQGDLSGGGRFEEVLDGVSTHEIKTQNRIIGVGIPEGSSIIRAVGVSNDDGFFAWVSV